VSFFSAKPGFQDKKTSCMIAYELPYTCACSCSSVHS